MGYGQCEYVGKCGECNPNSSVCSVTGGNVIVGRYGFKTELPCLHKTDILN